MVSDQDDDERSELVEPDADPAVHASDDHAEEVVELEITAVKPKRGRARKSEQAVLLASATEMPAIEPEEPAAPEPRVKAKRGRKPKAELVEARKEPALAPVAEPAAPRPVELHAEPEPTGPKKTGWWAKARQAIGGE